MAEDFDYEDVRGSVENHLGKENVGWVRVVSECFENIKTHCDTEGKSYPSVGQIKQKYGTLRIYLDGVREEPFIQSILMDAIQEADRSCERCGNASTLQCVGYWFATLCCWHAHEAAAERMKNFPRIGLNTRVRSEGLQCRSCGYHGQIAWGVSGHRCPACVSKGW
ncbi:hypothetical protein [Primorskyibacter sp. S87]|uniref:hypothetical protein n=1 Tax=Primorskyibacter sp. S87 TaxID=3415126 RepID=UPI003C79D798